MTETSNSAQKIGELLKNTLREDPHFYLFSPDETTSNKLDAVFESSQRAWVLPKETWDLPESEAGRVVELLSENTLFAVMVGHLLSGHQAMMTSYESFFPIITSQLLQHLKFLKQSEETTWRPQYPAVNLLSTSTCWRQDHNGFSHQSPMLISTLLDNPNPRVNCFFPKDAVSAEEIYRQMLNSKNVVNLTTFNKTDEPVLSVYSDENPDYIFTAAGDIIAREAIRAIEILREDLPEKRYRFVYLSALTSNGYAPGIHGALGTVDSPMSTAEFSAHFTDDKPIIANFHGYPNALRNILVNYAHPLRLSVHGFIEQGSTTTPFEMLSLNHASRYDLCIDVAKRENRLDLVEKYQHILAENHLYARETGEDLISVV